MMTEGPRSMTCKHGTGLGVSFKGGRPIGRTRCRPARRPLLTLLSVALLSSPHRLGACGAFVAKTAVEIRPLAHTVGSAERRRGTEPSSPLRQKQRMQRGTTRSRSRTNTPPAHILSPPYDAGSTSSRLRLLSLPTPSDPLIDADDAWGNVALLTLTATASQTLGKTTRIGRLLGPPVTAMAVAFLLGSIGVLPPGGSAGARSLQLLSLQLATPLLLLGADVRDASRRCGPLLMAFVLASIRTIVASSAALATGPCGTMLTSAMGVDGLKIAAALMAKNVGGGINYIAVCRSLGADPNAVAAGLCVDNIFALIYFPVTSALAAGRPDLRDDDDGASSEKELRGADDNETTDDDGSDVSVERVSTVLTLAVIATWFGEHFGGPSRALPISTFLTVAFATIAPKKWVASLRPAGEVLGTVLLYLFFATAGSAGLAVAESVRAAFKPIGLFLLILYGIHGTFLAAARGIVLKLAQRRRKERRSNGEDGDSGECDEGAVAPQRLLVASSAAIGGPATAAALAQANGWKSLTAPSLLVGNLGYAIATFAGLAYYAFFSRYFPK